jgi:hypothetical protein
MHIKFIRPFRYYQQGQVIDAFDGVADTFITRGFAEKTDEEPHGAEEQPPKTDKQKPKQKQ